LEADGSIKDIGEAASGQEALERLTAAPWHLLILDIHMPDRSGVDILGEVVALLRRA